MFKKRKTNPVAVAVALGATLMTGCTSATTSVVKSESSSAHMMVASMESGTLVAASRVSGGQGVNNPPLAALGPVPIPPDNPNTPAKVELGKMLFFEPAVGGDTSTPCSACHEPDQGWAWAEDISRGYPGTVHWRNSQTTVNSAYYPRLFWAGSVPSLEAQAKSAAGGAVAGNAEFDIVEARLALMQEYRKRFNEVFGDEFPLYRNAFRAIAAFERADLVQRDAPIDNYFNGDKDALSEEQKRGMALFNGKANCIECHNGAMATDFDYYNIGVPTLPRWDEDGLAQITYRYEMYAKGSNEEMYKNYKEDPGFYFRDKNVWNKGKFRVPSLRYTMYTAPYMHNGTLMTLEDVVDFYNQGGGNNVFSANKSDLIKPLGLSDEEKEDLVAFLEAFSGDEIEIERPKMPGYAPLFTKAELMMEKK